MLLGRRLVIGTDDVLNMWRAPTILVRSGRRGAGRAFLYLAASLFPHLARRAYTKHASALASIAYGRATGRCGADGTAVERGMLWRKEDGQDGLFLPPHSPGKKSEGEGEAWQAVRHFSRQLNQQAE